MDENTHTDIRRLLKRFGVSADEAITRHLENLQGHGVLKLRVQLEDLTEYPGARHQPLELEIEEEIRY